ncbi:DUF1127 domain-containing protein [Alginatibacterium sediminis]|uniref:DUF1127 domain-containing protein n=1 Tax=Alginatibacterium sediminis TaxID=2164068 RepID=A0A420E8E7_9ALTE|nr:DUF1127 domain-containing protein [Alginatibacterium sediminis]RKF15746.1 DUF1127 domain-containing protein [Alginatibacterium sediminis]
MSKVIDSVRTYQGCPPRNSLLAYIEVVNTWFERIKYRRQLQSLPDYLLKDVGLTSGDVYKESMKRFWQR